MLNEEAVLRVKRGAAWLDERIPGWEHRIRLDELNMSNGCFCVLGFVFASHARAAGMTVLYGELNGEPLGFSWAEDHIIPDSEPVRSGGWGEWEHEHGFVSSDSFVSGDVQYTDLDEAWTHLLRERRGIAEKGNRYGADG